MHVRWLYTHGEVIGHANVNTAERHMEERS